MKLTAPAQSKAAFSVSHKPNNCQEQLTFFFKMDSDVVYKSIHLPLMRGEFKGSLVGFRASSSRAIYERRAPHECQPKSSVETAAQQVSSGVPGQCASDRQGWLLRLCPL